MTPSQDSLPLPQVCVCRNPSCTILFGLCHCGCGGKTKITTKKDERSFRYSGMPMRFIKGHQGKLRPIAEEAIPFKINGYYCRLIPLTQGQYAIVWESDYKWLMQWKWYARWNPGMQCFYASRKEIINGKMQTIQMHRQILGLAFGDPRTGDHFESGNGLLNTRDNLRVATFADNAHNHRKSRANTSGYIGVRFHRPSGLYVAFIVVNNETKYLGYRKTAETAWKELYVPAAHKYHGEFARVS